MKHNIVLKIIEAGSMAPSGSNSQPWSFEVSGDDIYLYAHPEKDHPILNFHNRGTWLAHGACVENMMIAATALGVKTTLKIFPEPSKPNLTAIINCRESEPQRDTLYPYIPLRATNRKPYSRVELKENDFSELEKTGKDLTRVLPVWIRDREKINILGKASSVAEIMMLENEILHGHFMREIVWSRDEERTKKGGLYIKTMEVPAPAAFALKYFMGRWKPMTFFVKLGIPRMIAAANAKVYSSASAYSIITTSSDDLSFIEAGRYMERLWLQATRLGFQVHFLSGVPFLWQRIINGEMTELNEKHIQMVKESYGRIMIAGGLKHGTAVAGMLRIGKGHSPSARSEKIAPRIIWNK